MSKTYHSIYPRQAQRSLGLAETGRILLRPFRPRCYFPENPASGKVMEKCGFVDTGKEVLCPNLIVGSDRPVKVMKLCGNAKSLA